MLGLGASSVTAQNLVITGATVIDGTGRPAVPNAVVVITGDRITGIGAKGAIAIPPGATRIDGRGRFVIPCLMDANVHLTMGALDLESMIRYEDRFDELAIEAAQVTLKNGLTTVFDTYGHLAALKKIRDRINRGEIPGSRIYLAGTILGFTGPLGADLRDPIPSGLVSNAFLRRVKDSWEQGMGPELLWLPPKSIRPLVRSYAGNGVDFIKYGATGHGAWPRIATFNFIAFSPRVQRIIVEEAHRKGITVQAHTTTVESLQMAIDAGVDIVTHGDVSGLITPIPADILRQLADRGISVSIFPVTQRYLDTELEHAKGIREGYAWPQFQVMSRVNQRNMIRAGVSLLLSTDAVLPNTVLAEESPRKIADPIDLGEGHFNALVGLQEVGMPPMEILRSATSGIAKAYRVDRDLGTLEAGKMADLVILDRNPLESARNYRSISSVIKSGRIVDRRSLPLVPLLSAPPPDVTC